MINPEIIFEQRIEVISKVIPGHFNKANLVDQHSQLYIVSHVSFFVYLSFSVLNLEVVAFHFDVGLKTFRPAPFEHEYELEHLPGQRKPCPFCPVLATK